MNYIRVSFLSLLFVSLSTYASSFEFPIESYLLEGSLKSRLNKPGISVKDKVFIKQGHFYTYGDDEKRDTEDDVRIKFWGINLSPPLTFPESTEDAKTLAQSISNLGFNLVRIVGLDKFPVKNQYQSLLDAQASNPLTSFYPANRAGLERLLLALSEAGIYVSLVLKSGYTYDVSRDCRKQNDSVICVPDATTKVTGFSGPLKPNKNSKHVDIFNKEIREHLKLYADKIISVVKPYPNIAMIELNNENSLIELFRKPEDYLPPVYASELHQKWNNWLSGKYGTYSTMLNSWTDKTEIQKPGIYSYTDIKPGSWQVRESSVNNQITKYKYKRRNVRLRAGEVYAVKVTGESNSPLTVQINLLGNNKRVNTGRIKRDNKINRARTIDLCVRSTETVDNGIVDVTVLSGKKPLTIEFLKAKAIDPKRLISVDFKGADKIRGVETVRLNHDGSCFYPDIVYEDYLSFLYEEEDKYYAEMIKHLKYLIDVPINTTQAKYGGLLGQEIQIKHSDFITAHFYWDHPRIPSNDQSLWTMTNDSYIEKMDDFIGKMFSYSLIDGMPTVFSEFNVNHANQNSAGGYLTAAAYANFQDIDSLVLFTYYRSGGDTRNNMQNNRLTHWYNIIGDSRFATLSLTASNLFRRSENSVAEHKKYISVKERLKPIYWGFSIRGINKLLQYESITGSDNTFDLSMPLTNKYRLTQYQDGAPEYENIVSSTDELILDKDKNRVIIDTPQTQALIGEVSSTVRMSDVIVHANTSYKHGVIAVSSLTPESISRSDEILITLVKDGKNRNAEMLKVGERYRLCVQIADRCTDEFWSKAAGEFRVSSMKLNVKIRNLMKKARLDTLDHQGSVTKSIVVHPVHGVYEIELDGNRDKTLWYKLTEL